MNGANIYKKLYWLTKRETIRKLNHTQRAIFDICVKMYTLINYIIYIVSLVLFCE